MIKVILHGCNGKMGQVVAKKAASDPNIKIVAGIDKFPDAKQNDFPVFDSLKVCDQQADVVIDFSVHDAVNNLLEDAVQKNLPVVIATTGLSEDDKKHIIERSKLIPIFQSANMSIGINLMCQLSKKSASVLGNQFDIEIIEKHHNQKIDSPSGTAYALADAINEIFTNQKEYVYGRHSTNAKRKPNEIGIHAIRGGTIPGEHTVIFAGNDEVLEIIHTAYSREIFAEGAISAAKYLINQNPGLYDMYDVMAKLSSITHIHVNNDIAMISINNIPNITHNIAQIFKSLGDSNINIDMISQTSTNGQVNIAFTIPANEMDKVMKTITSLERTNPSIKIDISTDVTKLTVEGIGMKKHSGIAGRVFQSMANADIKINMITTSETTISYIVDKPNEKKAIDIIMKVFEL